MPLQNIAYSMLDLVAVRQGSGVGQAIETAKQTAQHAESLGFTRYWLAEHHNMPGLACSATAVLVGHIAAATNKIRVGSGGVMLPNHAPLVVAETFGTLAEIYPNRIDLGLGRAPGTDQKTMRALRRDRLELEQDFPDDVAELQALLDDAQVGQSIVATPGAGTKVPIWLLGSSLFSAKLAAQRGLPYAFASHFAPRMLLQALHVYRTEFQPSVHLQKPYAIVGVPIIAAPTDEEALFLASSTFQRILGIITGKRGFLQAPQAHYMESLQPQERAAIADFLGAGVIGGPESVQRGLNELAQATQADEFIFVSDVFDPALRLRSLSITAQVMQGQPIH